MSAGKALQRILFFENAPTWYGKRKFHEERFQFQIQFYLGFRRLHATMYAVSHIFSLYIQLGHHFNKLLGRSSRMKFTFTFYWLYNLRLGNWKIRKKVSLDKRETKQQCWELQFWVYYGWWTIEQNFAIYRLGFIEF